MRRRYPCSTVPRHTIATRDESGVPVDIGECAALSLLRCRPSPSQADRSLRANRGRCLVRHRPRFVHFVAVPIQVVTRCKGARMSNETAQVLPGTTPLTLEGDHASRMVEGWKLLVRATHDEGTGMLPARSRVLLKNGKRCGIGITVLTARMSDPSNRIGNV